MNIYLGLFLLKILTVFVTVAFSIYAYKLYLSQNQFAIPNLLDQKKSSAKLVGSKKSYQLTRGTNMVGRDLRFASIQISNDTSVSREHASIWQEKGIWYLQDLDSTFHTRLNDEICESHKKYLLEHGDWIKFGTTSLQFQIISANTSNNE